MTSNDISALSNTFMCFDMWNEHVGTLTAATVEQLAEKQHDVLLSRSPSKLLS